jgi:hypothetical protein
LPWSARQDVDERDLTWAFEVGEASATVLERVDAQRVQCLDPGMELDDCKYGLAPFLGGDTNRCRIGDRRVFEQDRVDLCRIDVDTARADQV